jgi:hypothetical protein
MAETKIFASTGLAMSPPSAASFSSYMGGRLVASSGTIFRFLVRHENDLALAKLAGRGVASVIGALR